jgi:hypothetical protein
VAAKRRSGELLDDPVGGHYLYSSPPRSKRYCSPAS